MNTNRRSFLTKSVLTMGALSASRVMGANEVIRLGFIGLGGRGMGSAKWFSEIPGVEVSYLCDADSATLDRAKKSYPKAKATQDLRKLVEDKDVDAVVVSTCNHWHVLASLWAIQNGKDVYVEKPISHNIWEGRKLVEAARKYKKIVQGGTQQRSDSFHAPLKEYLDSGALGKMKYVRCNHYSLREPIGKRDTPLTPPSTVDYDLWLGPAADLPITREKFHYDWHWVWNTGNGEMGNWGPHILDDLRNIVFRDRVTLPKRVLAGGGRFGWKDAGETPNTHFMYIDTGEVPVIVDVHNMALKKGEKRGDVYIKRKTQAFLIIECEGGYYAGGRGGGSAYDAEGKAIKKFSGDGGSAHAKNFIAALRSRKQEDLNAEIEQTHYSSAWCHLGNLSYQLGKNYEKGEAEARIADFEPWKEVLGDFHKHLDANEIDPASEQIKIGAMLEIDAAKETFTGPSATPEALAMLKGTYRKGFEVPEQV